MDNDQLIEHVTKAIKGEEQSLNALFAEYKDAVYCFLTHYMDNESDIEDVVQETFISAFQSLNKLENPLKIKSWIFTIAYRRAMDFYRVSKQPQTVQIPETLLENIEEDNAEFIPSEMLETEETRAYIVSLVRRLPESQKTAVLLYYYQQMTVTEIAEALNCSEGTVKSRLNYARKFIKADIDKQTKKGRKVLVVVPLPLLTQILLQQAEHTKLPSSASENILNGIKHSLKPAPSSVSTIGSSSIKVAGISISKTAAVIMGALSVIAVIALIIVVQPETSADIEQGTGVVTGINVSPQLAKTTSEGSESTVVGNDDIISPDPDRPQTKAEYAEFFYQYVQEVLVALPDFLDAEMLAGDNGDYSLILLFYNGVTHTDSENMNLDYDTVKLLLGGKTKPLYAYRAGSGDSTDSEYDYSRIYIALLDGAETVVKEPWNYPESQYNRPQISQFIKGAMATGSLKTDDESKLGDPISTWGWSKHGGNFEHTYGERLRAYFE